MEVVLRSCILLPPGHRRAVNHYVTAGAEPGLGETGGPRSNSPPPLHPVHSHIVIHTSTWSQTLLPNPKQTWLHTVT